MIEVSHTRQTQDAYAAAHAARGAAFTGLFRGFFRSLFRSAAPAKPVADTYGTVPLA
ncbi:hypothetical protein [Thalassobius sp. Cn5-15]|jgi:hypothetical protein|uniref:hypothetical protein n=1 Tax=Thalassobius sp. Cn5-15 TaxID=2917763 RepID=UPI001EF24806|nr:hypothetical protein [Thalassobius sp. Cn5-15]MCG7493396.1 hypothetical protein [Thalassobius sp. Cn5-15]